MVEHYAADQLHVVMHHIPFDFVTSGKPAVFPNGFVALYGDEFTSLGSEVAVHFGGGNLHCIIGGETCGCFAHGGEHDGKVGVQLLLEDVEDVFLMFVDFVPQRLALVEGEVFNLGTYFGRSVAVGFDCGVDFSAYLVDFSTQFVVGEAFERRAYRIDFVYYRLDFFEVALRFITKQLTQD